MPRELDDEEFAAAFMSSVGDDDDDHFLLLGVPRPLTGDGGSADGEGGSDGQRLLRLLDEAAGRLGNPEGARAVGRVEDRRSVDGVVDGRFLGPHVVDFGSARAGPTTTFSVNQPPQSRTWTAAAAANAVEEQPSQYRKQQTVVDDGNGRYIQRKDAVDEGGGYGRLADGLATRGWIQIPADPSPCVNSGQHTGIGLDLPHGDRRREPKPGAMTLDRIRIDATETDRMQLSVGEIPLSPRSPPSTGILSPSGRRSAIPVPMWLNPAGATAARSKVGGGDATTSSVAGVIAGRGPSTSPMTSTSFSPPVTSAQHQPWTTTAANNTSPLMPQPTSSKQRPQPCAGRDDVTNRRAGNDVTSYAGGGAGAFRRGDPARASMFERGSPRHQPARKTTSGTQQQQQAVAARRNVPQLHAARRVVPSDRPRSVTPPPAPVHNGDIHVFSPPAPLQPSYAASTAATRGRSSTGQQQPLTSTTNDRGQPTAVQRRDAGEMSGNVVVGGSRNSDRPYRGGGAGDSGGVSVGNSTDVHRMKQINESSSPEHSRTSSTHQPLTVDLTVATGSTNTVKDLYDDSSSKHSGSNIWECRVTITDVSDIIANLGSTDWMARRDGLVSLENMFRTGACLTAVDLKKVTDIFTRMFHDPQTKVFSVFIEVLVDFITTHSNDLGHWLPIALPRLFLKLNSELRASTLTKVHQALDTVRETFPSDLQLDVIARFINDQAQTYGLKVKEAVLDYLHELVLGMDTLDLVNSPTLQTLLLRVIMLTTDPQSAEVRHMAQAVIAAMFNLNSPEFVLAMTSQPKGAQDLVSRILKAHMYSTSAAADGGEQQQQRHYDQPRVAFVTNNGLPNSTAAARDVTDRNANQRRKVCQKVASAGGNVQLSPDSTTTTGVGSSTSPLKRISHLPTRLSQSEDSSNVPAAGSKLVKPRQLRRDCYSTDSGVVTADDLALADESSPETKTSPPFDSTSENDSDATELFGGNSVLTFCTRNVPFELTIDGNPTERRRQWVETVQTLSDNTARAESRKLAMRQLIDSLPTNSASISPSTVKSLLAVLLSATSANDEVSILASECAAMLLDSAVLPSERCLLLTELVDQVAAAGPEIAAAAAVNLATLQMLKSRLDDVVDLSRHETLSVITRSLIKAYENDDSQVRKASVDVLVKLYLKVGDLLWSHVHGLADYKVNYLRTRFRRAAVQKLCVADAV
jgi:CLIP-associating protein 1/2